MQEEVQDEQWKAHRCKLCPNCARAIEKMEGCDAMTCGQDYHGGNTQNGCGTKFNWSTAPAYTANANRRAAKQFNARPPEGVSDVDNGPFTCEYCQDTIKGLRFSCMNCKFLDVCENCEMRGIAIHDNHIFKIFNLS